MHKKGVLKLIKSFLQKVIQVSNLQTHLQVIVFLVNYFCSNSQAFKSALIRLSICTLKVRSNVSK